MKLAEALMLRSDRKKTFEQLRSRAVSMARYQEGEQPPEDANELLAKAQAVLTELEDLIARINRTNASAVLESSATLTDALAERDVLRMRFALLTSIADAAASNMQMARQMRTELKFMSAVSVPDLREEANETAKRHRELDARIQEANWRVDLIED
jgi:hypothetical protein